MNGTYFAAGVVGGFVLGCIYSIVLFKCVLNRTEQRVQREFRR